MLPPSPGQAAGPEPNLKAGPEPNLKVRSPVTSRGVALSLRPAERLHSESEIQGSRTRSARRADRPAGPHRDSRSRPRADSDLHGADGRARSGTLTVTLRDRHVPAHQPRARNAAAVRGGVVRRVASPSESDAAAARRAAAQDSDVGEGRTQDTLPAPSGPAGPAASVRARQQGQRLPADAVAARRYQ